jgi:hypothetical protein
MLKVSNTVIAWNSVEGGDPIRKAPPGSVAVGPWLDADGEHYEPRWTQPYPYTGGAADADRRKLFGASSERAILLDFYQLVYSYGLNPYVVHRAFVHIEEFANAIKREGMRPDKGEAGHDPEVGYGRCWPWPLPEIEIKHLGPSVHVWPLPR